MADAAFQLDFFGKLRRATEAARAQLLDFVNGVPGNDSILRSLPDIGRLILFCYILGMHDIQVGAADGFIVDLASLVVLALTLNCIERFAAMLLSALPPDEKIGNVV